MTDKEIIIEQKIIIRDANCTISDILDEHLGDGEGQFHRVGTWDCPKSPVGFCVYNPSLDRALDNCVFCHRPHDRK